MPVAWKQASSAQASSTTAECWLYRATGNGPGRVKRIGVGQRPTGARSLAHAVARRRSNPAAPPAERGAQDQAVGS